jgi:hypothetical protein
MWSWMRVDLRLAETPAAWPLLLLIKASAIANEVHGRSCRVPIDSRGDDRAKNVRVDEVLLLFVV